MTDNNGVLLSSDSITNPGTPDVKSGTIINQGSLINNGSILLSALFEDNAAEQAAVDNAVFTHHGYMENNASGVIEIGINSQQIDTVAGTASGNFFESTFENLGQLVNRGHIVVNDILFNSGVINNLEGAQFEKNGLINNTKLLTLTGGIMGADILLATYFHRAQVSALVIAPVDYLRRRRDRT